MTMRAWLQRAGLVLFGLVATLAVCEGGLRLSGLGTYIDHHVQYDELLGWSKISNRDTWYRTREYDVRERLNSRGLRDMERDYAKPPGVFRALVLGDSFTEAHSVRFEERFTTLLERLLNREGNSRRYEVINAGTDGYGTDQELLFYRSEGRKYRPDIILVMVYPENDVYYNTRVVYGQPKPRFVLESGYLRLLNVPVPKRAVSFRGHLNVVLGRSMLYRAAANRLDWMWGRLERLLDLGGTRAEDEESFSEWDIRELDIYRREDTKVYREAWLLTEALLTALRDETMADGAGLALVVIPSNSQVLPSHWSAMRAAHGLGADGWDLSKPNRRLAEICGSLKLICVDLLEVFRAKGGENQRLHYVRDQHLHPNGHRVVAESIYQSLARNW